MCVKCGMCINCGKNVYDWTEEGSRVARPYQCVVGCTTCTNLCPGNAVAFPDIDAVIFDTAPTGHTIRLLELPGGWSKTLEKSASTCIGPGASLQSAKAKYEKAISYLQDDAKTSFIHQIFQYKFCPIYLTNFS